MVKRILYMLVFLAIGLAMRAQPNYFFTHYSSEDGLSQNTVMSMLQDYKGNLWFGTWDGLNRFNGYSFKTYKARQSNFISLTNNRVDRLYEDIYGCLWLFTYDNRAHRFDPRTETFEQVPAAGEEGSSSNVLAIQVLSNGMVWLLTDGDGAIRVATNPKNNKWTAEIYSAASGLLSASRVYEVHQDQAGNEWLLTNNGLGFIRKGEKKPVSYFAETNGMHRHSNQGFYTVEESQDELFFGSDRGRVWRYQKKNGQFQLLQLSTASSIASVKCVSPTNVVIATATDGFFTYNLHTKAGVHYSHATCANLSHSPILSTYIDKTGEVWFEQEDPGVVVHFNPTTQLLKREQVKVEPTNTDRSHPAFHIHEDSNGVLWVHPYGGGFSYYDRAAGALVPFYDELGSADWKFSNKIHSVFSDKQGNLWICTHSKGLEKVTFRSVQFSMLTPTTSAHQSLSNEVRALCQDKDNNIWVGLKDGLLRVYDKNLHYKGFLTEQGSVSTTGTPMIGTTYFIKQDSEGTLWIATKGNGLVRAQPTGSGTLTYKLTRYRHNDNDIYSLSDNNVYCVHQDNNGRIWVATFAGGINYLSKDAQGKDVFINHHNHLKGYPIDLCYKSRFITSDKEGHLWVGTTAGALSFNENFEKPEDILFHHYARIPNQPKSLSNNDVHWIVANKKNELFLATFGGGLNKLISVDKEGNGVFKSYSVLDGLPSDVLLSIREDQKENLWISTENGISKFVPSKETFENYDDRSITFPVRFSEAASAFTSKGNLLFGSSSGVFMFHPDSIRKSNYIPPIVFSNLMIGNQTVTPGDKSILKEALDDTKELKLSHNENIFAIQFAALDYTNPANIQYQYMLEGLEKEWTYADKQRSVTYTNLSKGHYTFKVRSTNSDGVWVDNMRMLDIVVLPSFWETPLAYFLYILCVVLFIFGAVYILFTIYRLKHEVSVEQQVSDIKLRFFTNISHELRTPLTLIAGPVEHVLRNSQLPHDVHEQLVVVERNTNRMLRLVNQILDFRKIQNKKMKMQVQRVNVVAFVRKIMGNFESLAEEHRFDFLLETENEDLYLWVDADKLEKIVFNLLSNAFKYTPNGKLISVFIREDEETISIGVQDQGIGIDEKNKKSLFVRFESLVDINLFNQASTGIGLSLVKELVEMHKATITVDSKLGEGSCFQVKFLKGKDHYDNTVEFMIEDIVVFGGMEQVGSFSNVVESHEDTAKLTPEDDLSSKELMLLVEDNQELRFFLRSVFSKTYRVVEAVDGVEGWNKAVKFLPDIIISDVMMPVKDGILLTKELRQEVTTSHIPIVLLTAKTALDSKLEGLEYGADDYITKPFSATYLKARVENLLAQRKNLQRLYRDTLMSNTATTLDTASPQEVGNNQPKVPEMSPIDRKFMDKLLELMETNMDNGELVVDDLVSEVAVSRSVFFKKLKTLTGLAPIEFIKEMRIKRAAQLIESREFNMTQISYMVGINDPRYFSKCFKAKLGMTPTEYRDKVVGK